MNVRTIRYILPVAVALVFSGVVLAATASRASAQCGSQASSCKNCHEVQAKDPVNNDGNPWHQSHAFGDFCANCHGGNVQATDETAAHTGMVPALSDLKTNCGACHPDDLQQRGDVYAKILGVTVDAGAASPPPTGGGDSTPTGSSGGAPAAPPASSIVVSDSAVIDYAQRYDQQQGGLPNINWGDAIVVALIVAVIAGGGAFVYWNERRRRGPQAAPKAATSGATPARLEDYPPEVLAMLPLLAKLNPVGLHALRRLLDNPDSAAELLHSLSRLDPELVRRIRALDRDSRALLMGLAGD
ncbi:MAG: cytochrome c3 family protein [Chloroflexi bacterium]|nr:cytochrome c3 family protein [Chloroflexota bacterium]